MSNTSPYLINNFIVRKRINQLSGLWNYEKELYSFHTIRKSNEKPYKMGLNIHYNYDSKKTFYDEDNISIHNLQEDCAYFFSTGYYWPKLIYFTDIDSLKIQLGSDYSLQNHNYFCLKLFDSSEMKYSKIKRELE